MNSPLLRALIGSTLLLVVAVSAFVPHKSSASLVGFDAGNLMSDGVMSNKGTMTVENIQSFLNTKVPTCTTNQLRGYNNESRAIAPCLKDYSESGQTAAQIIWQASQDYSVNPQVLLVLLEKEQGLITDTWPRDGWLWTKTNLGSPVMECTNASGQPRYCVNTQYRSATGYGCYDTAPCDAQYYGFTNQVRKAASLFHDVLNGGWSNYPVGVNYIQYNPDASCGGSYVTIKNLATSALYRYTPYQPNPAALAAGTGTASCGAYGNRNFYNQFTEWFGSTVDDTIASSTYRLWDPKKQTHLFTAKGGERLSALRSGYKDDGQNVFKVVPTQEAGTVPIYSLWHGALTDNWLLPDGPNLYWALIYAGYANRGVAFYAYPANPTPTAENPVCPDGTVGLRQMWQPGLTEHFYSVNGGDHTWALLYGGYVDDGSSAYKDGNGGVSFCVPQ